MTTRAFSNPPILSPILLSNLAIRFFAGLCIQER